jgi:hypothetical protein
MTTFIEIQKDDQPVFRRIFGLHSVQDGITNVENLGGQLTVSVYRRGVHCVLIIIYYGVVHLEVSVGGSTGWHENNKK